MVRRAFAVALGGLALGLAACPAGDDDDDDAPILVPEPPGAPEEVADGTDEEGRTTLGCLGRNAPDPPEAAHVTLLGWVRAWADPTNTADRSPDAAVEAFDETGTWLASAASDIVSGRLAMTVPIREAGFLGSVMVHPVNEADGYWHQRFVWSLPVTGTTMAGWSWLVTADEIASLAATAGVEIDPDRGILAGAVHDCDGFGVANAVIRWGDRTDGVEHLVQRGDPAAFDLEPGLTFTTETGRFAIPNVEPGVIAVEAYGRLEAGGPLVLLSHAEIEVSAGIVSAVGLEPRAGLLH